MPVLLLTPAFAHCAHGHKKRLPSVHDFVLGKFLKDEFNSMKTMFDEAAEHEGFLIKLAGEAKTKCYWVKASKRQHQQRRSTQAADSGDDA